MTVTIEWQHWILVAGAIVSAVIFFKGYEPSRDQYGIEGIFRLGTSLICGLLFVVAYLGLYYFGAFT